MWMWILAALAIGTIWIVGGYLGLSVLYRVLASVVVVLAVLAVLLFRRVRAARAAKALEAELLRQAEDQAKNARPDRRGEILELQQRFQQGIASLKSTKLASGTGRSALYALPWYMIIGPPGAGKTTALKQSGLEFPFLDPNGGGIRGVGGTRNCDWWFANEAILLDTAGRYTTEADDHDEWLAFLGLLKKFRPQKPLNGVIVSIAVSELAAATDEQIDNHAKRLRARIDEVMTRLEMIVPVYVMFTKVDLIAGFSEFFGGLRKSERAQIWGATLSLDTRKDFDPGKSFDAEFDLLTEALHARTITRLASERDAEILPRVFQFPIEFSSLKRNLGELVSAVFAKNAYQETPIFRGFYFTSGTQEGRPMDLVVGSMARAFGIRAQPEGAETAKESKSYFVTDFFRKVVFPDQSVAARTARETRRLRVQRVAAGALALSVGLIVAGPATCTHQRNQALVTDSRAIAQEGGSVEWGDTAPPIDKIKRLDRLRGHVQQLFGWKKDGAPVGMRWGMYVGDRLYEPLRSVYLGALQSGLEQGVKRELEGRLRSIDLGATQSADAYNRAYEALKTYLMMSDKARLDPAWVGPRLPVQWEAALHTAPDPALETAMRPHVDFYLELMKNGEVPPWTVDKTLIARARSILLQVSQLDREYEALVRDANGQIAPIRLETIFYGSVAPFVLSKKGIKVPGAYTKLGWMRVKPMLDLKRSKLNAERWVLDEAETSGADVTKQIERLRELYFERYKNAWREFLLDIDVHRPANADKALDELSALSEPEWPYLRLMRTLNDNVTLDVDDSPLPTATDGQQKVIDKIVDDGKKKILGPTVSSAFDTSAPARPISPVEKAFRPLTRFAIVANPSKDINAPEPPTGLSQYQQLLAKLIGVMTDLKDSKAAPDPKAVATEFQEAFRTTSALLADQDGFTRPMLSPLLMRPITLGWGAVLHDAGGAAGGLWELNVWNKWAGSLDKKYPFTESPVDASLADFNEFFKPNTGLLWAFYEQSLKGSIERQGTKFVPTRRFKASIPYTPAFLTCLERGWQITQAMFPAGSDKALVDFEINLHSVSSEVSDITLDIDGTPFSYKNTPEEWVKVQWPVAGAKLRSGKLRARGFGGLDEELSRVGDFGFLRLLDAADVKGTPGAKPGAPGAVIATWDLRTQVGGNVKIDVRPAKTDHPFFKALFRGYQCPRVIVGAEQ